MISFFLFAAMTSSEALSVILNTPGAVSAEKYEEASRVILNEAAAGKRVQQYVAALTVCDKKLANSYLEQSRPVIRVMAENRRNPLAWYLLSMEDNNFHYLEKAAAAGNVQALNAMGSAKLQRSSREKDKEKAEALKKEAFKLFKSAAMKLDTNALVNVGVCCMSGIGCRVNKELAFECFKNAAKKGQPEAMMSLSACYSRGDGVAPDSSLALYWSMKAKASRGDKSAARWLEKSK